MAPNTAVTVRLGRTERRDDMASSGCTLMARHAGRTDAARAPPNAIAPVKTMHHVPSDAPLRNRSDCTRVTTARSPPPASKPPPQPINARKIPSMAMTWATCPRVRPTARMIANWRTRSVTPMLSVVKMMNSAASSERPVAAHACCLARVAIMPSSMPVLMSSTPRMEAAGRALAIRTSHVLRNCVISDLASGFHRTLIRLILASPRVKCSAKLMGT